MKNRIFHVIFVLILLSFAACDTNINDGEVKTEDEEVIIEDGEIDIEDEKETTVIDDIDEGLEEEPNIVVEEIEQYENVIITDWLSDDTVIVSKENNSLDKMKFEELSHSYPRSLYLFDINTNEYILLKEKDNMFLGDANLSPDKKHLLYSGNTLGDPSYFMINMDTIEDVDIGENHMIEAWSVEWADSDTIIGSSHSGGVYFANTTGEVTRLDDLKDESIVVVMKMKDKIYYNTNADASLMVYDQSTKEKSSSNIENVYGVLPSSDENQLLILQNTGSKQSLILYDTEGNHMKTIAEGTDINGVSWSPNQKLIAYSQITEDSSLSLSSIYLYDISTGESTQIIVDVSNSSTYWSPSGNKLAYSQWDGKEYSSSIVSLKFRSNES